MQHSNDILNELRDVAPLIAESNSQEIYVVPTSYFSNLADQVLQKILGQQITINAPKPGFQIPPGYFEGLAGNIMQKIKVAENRQNSIAEELKEVAPLLNDISKKNLYTVPAGYFEELAGDINQKNDHSGKEINSPALELQETAPLLNSINRQYLYSVPENYFQELTANILFINKNKQVLFNELKEVAPVLNTISNNNLYTVPVNFFEIFAETVTAKIGQAESAETEIFNELEEITPLLNNIARRTPYEVPEGYFENISISIPAQTKIVPLGTGRKWYRYAVAASVAGLMIFAGTTWFKGNKFDLTKFNQVANTNVQKEISGIADEDIINYLDHQPIAADFAVTNTEEQDPDVNEYIHNAGTDEIESYLNDNAEPGENENVIKKI